MSDNEQSELQRVLQEWRVPKTLPARFQEGVWKRIDRLAAARDASAWGAIRRWFESPLPRRSWAIGCVAALALLGSVTGYWQGQQKTSRLESVLAAKYLQSVDPYQSRSSSSQ